MKITFRSVRSGVMAQLNIGMLNNLFKISIVHIVFFGRCSVDRPLVYVIYSLIVFFLFAY